MQIKIYYEDIDSLGIVYHANYIKFCERARSDIFFKNGLKPEVDGHYFVVKNIDANFLGTASLGDILDIKTQILSLKNASVILSQKIFKQNTFIFDMNITLACLKDKKISKIPNKLKDILLTINKNQIT